MKKYYSYMLLILSVVLFALSSCASMRLENYEEIGSDLLYMEDFTQGEDIESLDIEARHGFIKLENDALHFHAAENGNGNGATFQIPLRDNVLISFRLMLGPDNPTGHPSSHINFLWNDNGGRICINFDQNSIGGFINYPGGGNGSISQISQTGLKTNQWYDLTFVVLNRKITIFKNGTRLKTISLNDKIPASGRFVLECHQDMWVDDLIITRIDDFILKED